MKKFLKAKAVTKRCDDNTYLSAWFVTFYCMTYKVNYNRDFVNWSYYNYMDYFIPTAEDVMEITDFTGIGIHNGEYSDTNYTYVITNVDKYSFNIWVYNGKGDFIDLISIRNYE